ncbi:hypothetical protein XELAEV_18013212mg [Xenopus laevis]|uniref:Uncharacterized protein n=1 Tax=Xenopus laevis TaxID=8355 RepID=A0A974D4Q0_XENLA|nr:hypothetical protein XELAEV_18022399mg [Xenopus laevis]OCT95526.1 hypothetical protein XELAEV_18013212mg [Xenopus laevis]
MLHCVVFTFVSAKLVFVPCVCSHYLILFLEFPYSSICTFIFIASSFVQLLVLMPAIGDVISCYGVWGKAP